jgi:phosphatidylinositol kinase/protein kinase (PI-3  family)
MQSKERPKKVTFEVEEHGIGGGSTTSRVGGGGSTSAVNFLCKREAHGDLRKDARLMEFNAVVNRMLKRDAEGRQRKLKLRTYAVICLNEEAGLLEVKHVSNSRAHVL